MNRSGRVGGAVALFVAVALVVGCGGGSEVAEVSGTVKYNDVEVEDGAITFFPADGKGPTAGGTIKGGRYTAQKVPVGNTKVVISGSKVVGKKKIYDTPNSQEMPITKELLPPKYSDAVKTELTYEAKPGPNEKNWELAK